MTTRTLLAFVLIVSSITSLGCSGGDPASPQASGDKPVAQAGSETDDPIAIAAHDFMDAVFKNDLVRATGRLTPLAIQNMQAQDKRFEWGEGAAKLRVDQVRKVSDTEAAVQFVVTQDEQSGGSQEQLVCLLRQIEGQWRVFGLACESPASGQAMQIDFEDLPTAPPAGQPQPQDGQRYVQSPPPAIPAAPQPSPGTAPPGGAPRSASQPPPGVYR